MTATHLRRAARGTLVLITILITILITMAVPARAQGPGQPPGPGPGPRPGQGPGGPPGGQKPPENLKFFPKDITREELIQRMREFSFALGVRCQYCHAGGDGQSMDGIEFKSDEKPTKERARFMLRMVRDLNTGVLPNLPGRTGASVQTAASGDTSASIRPAVTITCVTCHRGLSIPKSLADVLADAVASDGIPAAVKKYRDLRQNETLSGRYDFGEWSINELARRLTEQGNTEGAIAMLELNGEFYPKSGSIDLTLAELHLKRSERDKALARLRLAVEKEPNNRRAKQRLDELTKAPPQ